MLLFGLMSLVGREERMDATDGRLEAFSMLFIGGAGEVFIAGVDS